MKVIAVDDERPALGNLVSAIKKTGYNCDIRSFTSSEDAIVEVKDNDFLPDIAFVDIEMPGISGLELVKQIKNISPKTKFIFVTGFPEYALEAYKLHARGYIMKPITSEKITAELEYMQKETPLNTGKIIVKTFGNFEVYANGEPIKFKRSKSKELFAYLVSKNGARCKIREVAAVLFEDSNYDIKQLNYTQKIISSMIKAFESIGEKNIIKKGYNSISLNKEQIDCDYYKFLEFDIDSINSYMGEFMSQYSWAEFVAGYLDSKQYNAKKD